MVPIPTSPILSITKTLVPAAPTWNGCIGVVVKIPTRLFVASATNVLTLTTRLLLTVAIPVIKVLP